MGARAEFGETAEGQGGQSAVRSIERACRVLKCFSLYENRLNLSAIAGSVGLSPSTALRILSTLVSAGVLKRNRDRSYSLGDEFYIMGAMAKAHFTPPQIAYPQMKELRDETLEAVSLFGVEGEERVCYEHLPSPRMMRSVIHVGDRLPLWAGAAGKALLAYAGDDVIEREAAKISRVTGATPLDRETLIRELAEVRRRDYAISRGELEEGVMAIAVPIFDTTGQTGGEGKPTFATYCISLSAPSTRVDDDLSTRLVYRMQEISAKISRQMS